MFYLKKHFDIFESFILLSSKDFSYFNKGRGLSQQRLHNQTNFSSRKWERVQKVTSSIQKVSLMINKNTKSLYKVFKIIEKEYALSAKFQRLITLHW